MATNITRLVHLRSMAATSSSIGVSPSLASTRKSITSASSTANCTCLRISSSNSSSPPITYPPVSIMENRFPFQSDLPYWRSRVTPEVWSTMAVREAVKRLKRVDLPTLGRPTIATILLMRVCCCHVSGLQQLFPSTVPVLLFRMLTGSDTLLIFSR